MCFKQDAIDAPSRIETFWCNNLPRGGGMSWWQLATLIIFVGFLSCDVSDLEVFFLVVDWVIFDTLSSEIPERLSSVIIWHGRDMSWWKWDTLIIYVGFLNLDGPDLEGFVSDFDFLISKRPSSSTSLSGEEIWLWCNIWSKNAMSL